jgi:hypothetical protein
MIYMMTEQEHKQVVDALEFTTLGLGGYSIEAHQAKVKMNEALAMLKAMQPVEQEPVCYLCENNELGIFDVLSDKACKNCFPVYRKAENLDTSQERVQMLLEALKELRHAVNEVHQAHINPNWFTGGERAARLHQITWIIKASEVSNTKARAEITAVEGKT